MATDLEKARHGEWPQRTGSLAGWVLSRIGARLRGSRQSKARLKLVERIALAPRQTLALVEAEGRRFLVAASADGSPSFYPLDERAANPGSAAARTVRQGAQPARISW